MKNNTIGVRHFLITLLLIGATLPHSALAQKQANVWVFGDRTVLDFNTNPPTFINSGSGTTPSASTASIADSSGRLLLWTTGSEAYGQLGLIANGAGLSGNLESSQSSIIVPRPGSDSLFYIFTSDNATYYQGTSKPSGYNYSIVNMCLGRRSKDSLQGGIVAGQKNIHLVDSGTEKLCAASDGANGYWILGHRGFSDSFIAWHLTSAGIAARVATKIGPFMGVRVGNTARGLQGQMKFNAAVTRVAAVTEFGTSTTGTIDLFDFDPQTGKLSNHCQNWLNPAAYAFPFGIEFSPDGSKIYTSYSTGSSSTTYLLKNITTGDCTSTGLSRDTAFELTRFGYNIQGIQAAPDGNLYVCLKDAGLHKVELHRVRNSNTLPVYDTGVYLNNKNIVYDLNPPSFVAGFKYKNRRCNCAAPASIETTSAMLDVKVSPNPVDGLLSFTPQSPSTHMKLVITDVTGKIILSLDAMPQQIDMRNTPSGLYIYRIVDDKGRSKLGKFVVAHR